MSSIIASLHYVALAIGFGSIFMRGRYLRHLKKSPKDLKILKQVLAADGFWGVAAILWMATGFGRAFGGLEKGTDWYLHNPLFFVKMGLLGLVFILEAYPMYIFIRWRISLGTKTPVKIPSLLLLQWLNDLESILVILIVFVASAMARGLWY